jgi:hypothetical protein
MKLVDLLASTKTKRLGVVKRGKCERAKELTVRTSRATTKN